MKPGASAPAEKEKETETETNQENGEATVAEEVTGVRDRGDPSEREKNGSRRGNRDRNRERGHTGSIVTSRKMASMASM